MLRSTLDDRWVSKEVAEQMAKGVADKLKTDCSIAVQESWDPTADTGETGRHRVDRHILSSHVLATLHHLDGKREDNIRETSERALLQMINLLKGDE